MNKGITPIIGIIIILLIVIALAGTAYVYLFGITTYLSGKTISFVQGSENQNKVVIKNLGTETLQPTELTVTVQGQNAPITSLDVLYPTEGGLLEFDSPVYGNNLRVRIIGPTNTLEYIVDIEATTETICGDFIDNDGDSLIDCEDPDCDGMPCNGGTCISGICVPPGATVVSVCQIINTPGLYLLNQSIVDHSGDCYTLASTDILFDCLGNTIDGVGSNNAFIDTSALNDSIIRNCNITDFSASMVFDMKSNNVTITNNFFDSDTDFFGLDDAEISYNTFLSTSFAAMYLEKDGNNITGNNITCSSGIGIYLYASSNNDIIKNKINNCNQQGIYLDSSSNNNNISGNILTGNQEGVSIFDGQTGNVYQNNIINGNTIGFYIDSSATNGNSQFSNNDLCSADGQTDWLDANAGDACSEVTASGNSKWNDASTCTGVTNTGCP